MEDEVNNLLRTPVKVSIVFKQSGITLSNGFYTLVKSKGGFVILMTESNELYRVNKDIIAYMKNAEIPKTPVEPELKADYEGVIGVKGKKRR